MLKIERTTSADSHFQQLVHLLDAELAIRDGDEHDFYHQFNKIDMIRHAVVAYEAELPVGCGALKRFDDSAMEVKRMFVKEDQRGKGIAADMLNELETWAIELGYAACILETGKKQPEAIALYKKAGYQIMPNYGQYQGVANSVCMRKQLS